MGGWEGPRERVLSLRTGSQDRPLLFLPQASTPQVRTAPILRYLTWPRGHGQNTRHGTGPRAPKSDFPSPTPPNPTPPAIPSADPTRGSAAKAKAGKDVGPAMEAGHARGGAREQGGGRQMGCDKVGRVGQAKSGRRTPRNWDRPYRDGGGTGGDVI